MQVETLQAVALAVAAERSVDAVLRRIVDGLVSQSGAALARVWLIDQADVCDTCPLRADCLDRSRCLHLVASAGVPLDTREDWSRLEGAFRRFPLGVRKIGRIGASGEGILIEDVTRDAEWIVQPEWIRKEHIRSFGGQPLIFRGEVLGVLGVFSREPGDPSTFAWLRTFADHAAMAIAHARALVEIERLKERLELENAYLREELRGSAPHGFIGDSPALAKVLGQVAIVAPTTATVLIEGESGTGKELVARALHDLSPRRQRALISVNCASVPRELFESEFFGHARGAFTGALRDRAGRFQAADGGTLFLDEVGEIPMELQGKLLRVLQEGQFQRVGEDATRRVDVRVIAATNRNLRTEAAAGRFREDLFYRLSVFPLVLPPLRDRPGDVGRLATYFVDQAAKRHGCRVPRVTRSALATLEAYGWPGNVRELQHVIERAVLLSRGGTLDIDELLGEAVRTGSPAVPAVGSHAEPAVVPQVEWRRRERENVQAALQLADGRIYGPDGAAERLGVKPTTLISRLKALGLREREQRSPRRERVGGPPRR